MVLQRLAWMLSIALLLGIGSAGAQMVGTEPSDPRLLSRYQQFNAAYFSGKLPTENFSIRWADETGAWFTHYEGEPLKVLVTIDRRLEWCERCVNMNIFHEMAHMEVMRHINLRNHRPWKAVADEYDGAFQKVMRRLARRRAFAPYW